ncbi:protein shisa-5 [Sphaerodactylus townsendi]|uniref:protein shisa-5 n=1 Tax=Sphaerodactylus townsendi TaxID=933632 RepID=UPI0020271508|nr:protein shisa-5 [Sphaerodactylus townsendi]
MACGRGSRLALGVLRSLLLVVLLPGGFCENCTAYKDSDGHLNTEKSCLEFCCGTCTSRYCCSDFLQKLDEDVQLLCNEMSESMSEEPVMGEAMKFRSDFDDWEAEANKSFGTFVAIGVTLFVLFIVTVILCFTCSCCCLYKACRRTPQPIVTTTTATTVVQVPYPQQPGTSPGYPGGYHAGYHPVPVQPQPGAPVAPYPTQYPPPYPMQPAGPPAYHETMAGAGAPYPTAQPPYNPAYMDPPKPSY